MRNAMWVGGGITGMGEIPMLGVKEKGIAKVIRDIFRNGEQGFFYDPLDLSMLYQDSAGTIPVSGVGQAVGLVLDKSKGLLLGNNLASPIPVPGIFDAGSGTIGTWDAVTSTMGNSGIYVQSRPRFNFNFTTVVGKFYKIYIELSGDISQYNSIAGLVSKTVGSVLQISGFINATSTSSTVQVITNLQTGGKLKIDKFQFQEILGNHAYQTTSAARPIFRQKPILGSELMVNGGFDSGYTSWSTWGTPVISHANGIVDISFVGSTGGSGLYQDFNISAGKTVRVTAAIKNVAAKAFISIRDGGSFATTRANQEVLVSASMTYVSFDVTSVTGSLRVYISVQGIDSKLQVDWVSVKDITSYRTDQNSIEYDGIDDKLITKLPSALTNCTVLRAIPNVGTQVKYNQTLPMLYEDATNHTGLIAIDRVLTPQEQLSLMTEFDKRAGVKSLEDTVDKLFDNNQVGFLYDPNDLSTMYQDAVGTKPVTDVGQPVGLLLDKSKQLQRGVNLTKDFDFRTWGILSGSTTEKSSFTVVGFGGVTGNVGMVAGKTYKIDIEYTNTNPTKSVDLLNGNHGGSPTVTTSASGKISAYCLAANALLYLRTSASTITVTKFVVQEVLGNHAYQSTSASRPILRKNAETGANYLEFDGSDDFLQTANIDFTSTDKLSLFAGVNKTAISAATALILELSENAGSNAGSFFLAGPNSANISAYGFRARGLTSGSTLDASSANIAVISAFSDLSVNKNSLRLNSSEKVQNINTGGGSFGKYPLYIGRRGGGSLSFTGHLYSLIAVGKLIPESDVKRIEQGIANFLGVTLNV